MRRRTLDSCALRKGHPIWLRQRKQQCFEYSTCDVDNAVEFDRVVVDGETTKEEVATSKALCMRGREIRRIGVDVEYHV